jgi:hypothetical protein
MGSGFLRPSPKPTWPGVSSCSVDCRAWATHFSDHMVLTGREPHGLAADSGGEEEEGEGEVQLAPEGAHIINVIKTPCFPLSSM